MRRAKVDANQPEIIEALRKAGCSVQPLHTVGKGVPDLLVGHRGHNYLFELKNGNKQPSARKLTDDQVAWHQNWRGQIATIMSAEEALRFITQEGGTTNGIR